MQFASGINHSINQTVEIENEIEARLKKRFMLRNLSHDM